MLEVVDELNQSVPTGELGAKVLITNLANTVQPFIRYEVGDQVVMATKPCRCGSRLPRIARIEGRSAEIFEVQGKDGNLQFLPGVLFHHAVDSLQVIREWQAVQHDIDKIELRLESLAATHLAPDAIRHQLSSRLYKDGVPPQVSLEIHFVPALNVDHATGKFRRMINLCTKSRRAG